MALALYSRYLYYPGGGQAAGRDVPVFLTGSNVEAMLFADREGTTPAPNPAVTDADGLLSFYAAPGMYSVPFAGESYLVEVDPAEPSQVHPGLFVHEQETPATTWTIAHHFGIEPRVDVMVNKASTVPAAVTHPDTQTTVVTFASPTAGTAHLRR